MHNIRKSKCYYLNYTRTKTQLSTYIYINIVHSFLYNSFLNYKLPKKLFPQITL